MSNEITEVSVDVTDEPAEIDPAKYDQWMNQLRAEQSLLSGVLAGLAAAIISAALWAAISVATGYQIGYLAVAIGFLVGFAVRIFGKGLDPVYGYVGGGLALFGCAFGNLLTISYFVAEMLEIGFFEFLTSMNVELVTTMMTESFAPMDLLFYGIAIYEGYKFAFRSISEDELNQLAVDA